jgi:glycosyltransferase involved in cell wall biosynthesis
MRVAILSTGAELGGAERSLLTFLKAAQGRLIDAIVLLPREGPLADALTKLTVPWEIVPMPTSLLSQSRQGRIRAAMLGQLVYQSPIYLWRLVRALRRIKPAVLYTNGIKSNLLGALLRPWLRLGVVWHLRDVWGGKIAGFFADRGTDCVIANSGASAQALQTFMAQPEKVFIIYNAVDLEEFSPGGLAADCGPGNRFAPKVGLIAAFARLKGQLLFLEAARRIRAEFPGVGFFLVGGAIYDTVGEQGYEAEVRRLAEAQGLGDSVVFTGFQKEVAPWYRAMDIVVNCSIRPESFGRTLLEAMACGKAVVGPNAGGIPEFVQPGKTGLLYEMGNADALAEAVLSLLREPAWRQNLGTAGHEAAVRRFAPQPHAQAISRILLEGSLGVLTRGIC